MVEAVMESGVTGELFVHPQIGIITFSGVSAAGKNWTAEMLQRLRSEMQMVRSYTTRSLRPGAQDREYEHVTLEEFEQMRSDFLWTTQPHQSDWYGTRMTDIHDAMLADAPSVMHIIPSKLPDLRNYVRGLHSGKGVLSILVVCKSEEMLRARMRSRDPSISAEKVEERLHGFADRQAHWLASGQFHYVIESSDGKDDKALQAELRCIVSEPIPEPRAF